jgi:hypothetical protein
LQVNYSLEQLTSGEIDAAVVTPKNSLRAFHLLYVRHPLANDYNQFLAKPSNQPSSERSSHWFEDTFAETGCHLQQGQAVGLRIPLLYTKDAGAPLSTVLTNHPNDLHGS